MNRQGTMPGQVLIGLPEGRTYTVEWRVAAIVEDDTQVFAKSMQDILSANTADGYVLQSMFSRNTDNGLVMVFQKVTLGAAGLAPSSGMVS